VNTVLVRVAHVERRWGLVVPSEEGVDSLQRGLGVPGYLVVLADDAGHRALPAWLRRRNPGGVSIDDLVDRPVGGMWTTAPVPEELSVRLVQAAGGNVAGVEIYPVTADPEEVNADTCAARIELGASHVTASLDQGLRLAVVAGAQVRVDAAVMDRLAVPTRGDDPAAPFHEPPVGGARVMFSHPEGRVLDVPVERIGERPRFEPRNMAFADGLDRWLRYNPVPDEYSAMVEDSCATLSSAVPEPSGSAALMQTIFADDFRGAPVVFRGEYRIENVAGSAGLCLRILWRGKEPDREQERVATAAGSRDWSSDEISALIPEDADMIRFGVILTGSGRVWLRNPELRRRDA
jgi:hypothetical protein